MLNAIHLLETYGAIVVFLFVFVEQVGLPLPAFPVLMLVGAKVANGNLSHGVVYLVVSVAACLTSDLLWYAVGRRKGMKAVRLLCWTSVAPEQCVISTASRFADLGPKALLLARFVPGMGLIAAPVSGAIGTRRSTFILFSILSSSLWASAGLFAGALLRDRLDTALSFIDHAGIVILLLILIGVAAFVIFKVVARLGHRRKFRNVDGLHELEVSAA